MGSPLRPALFGVTVLAAGVVLALTLLRNGPSRGPDVAIAPPTAAAPSIAESAAGQLEVGPGAVAVQGYEYGQPGHSATRDKAQSKVWHHDGSWWATMIEPYAQEVRIFELVDGIWTDTGVLVDARERSNADVLWTGSTLYIASRTSGGDLLLQRYRYGPDRTWVAEWPTAALISPDGGRSLAIAVDSVGRVWASWIDGTRVWIASSAPGGRTWNRPVTPPGGDNVREDDATDITEFAGQIGVMWSNQEREAFLWTSREDTAPLGQWSDHRSVREGVNIADGHINFAVSPTGDVWAAVKTSLGDDGEPAASPLIEVLRRLPDGSWERYTAASVADQMTRAQLMITADGEHLVLVATSPQPGGEIYFKIATTEDPKFTPGKGSVLMAWNGAVLNDVSTPRAPVDISLPVAVLASDREAGRYYHSLLSLDSIVPPK